MTRWNPVSNMFSRWPSIWDDNDFELICTPHSSNSLEIYETKDRVVVRANVAGIDVKEVDVTFEKGTLWIKAARTTEPKDEDAERTYYSKSNWEYSYKISVPGVIDIHAEPSAEIDNGVITITFPKTESAEPRKVEVTAK